MSSDSPTPNPRKKTHCKRGHDLSIFGRPHKNGGRTCDECNLIRNRADYVPDAPAAVPANANRDQIIKRYEAGEEVRSITAALQVSSRTVYRILNEAGVAKRNKKQVITSADIEAAWAELMAEGTEGEKA